jgi:hypothetical protein
VSTDRGVENYVQRRDVGDLLGKTVGALSSDISRGIGSRSERYRASEIRVDLPARGGDVRVPLSPR